jgi:hypothetical protein
MRRFTSTLTNSIIRPITFRIGFYSYWTYQESKLTPSETATITTLRQHFPTLYTVLQHALCDSIALEEIGRFIRLMHNALITLVIFSIQTPTPAQTTEFSEMLRSYVLLRCPNIKAHMLQMRELATLTQDRMNACIRTNPHMAQEQTRLLPLEEPGHLQQAFVVLNPIVKPMFTAMMHSFVSLFRAKMDYRAYTAIRRGYWDETKPGAPSPPWPGLELYHSMVDGLDFDHRPTGDRVPIGVFCRPAEDVSAGETCSVCMSGIQLGAEDEEENAVVTGCEHLFHQGCLDRWVNESCMRQSNRCPECRREMCVARQVIHVSQLQLDGTMGEPDYAGLPDGGASTMRERYLA